MSVCSPNWFAVYTKPRQEHIALLNLEWQRLATERSTRGVAGIVRAGLELIKIPASVIAGLKTRKPPENGLAPLNSIGPAALPDSVPWGAGR